MYGSYLNLTLVPSLAFIYLFFFGGFVIVDYIISVGHKYMLT